MTATFTYDSFNLNDSTTYKVLQEGVRLLAPPAVRHTVTPYAAVAKTTVLPRTPGTGLIMLPVLVKGSLITGALETAVDALIKVLNRPGKLLVASLLDTRRVVATVTAIEPAALTVAGAVFNVTFSFDSYWETAAPSGSVQTGALSSLVALGLETGNAYGHRLSLTPGGNAPTTPRVLLCVQAGSQTPTRFTLRSLYTSPPEALTVSLSLAGPALLSFDPVLQRAVSLATTNVVGYWPLADAALGPKDFSGDSRDLTHDSDYKTAVTADSPVAWWRMEETDSSSAADSAGANTGTYQNSPTGGITGLITEAGTYGVRYNGTTQYLTYPDAAAVDLGDTFTIELWLARTDTTAASQILVDKGDQAYQLVLTAAHQIALAKVNVGTIVTSTSTINDTGTHHVVATKSGATVKLYIDGVDRTGTVNNQTCTNNALSGGVAASRAGASPFKGTLDEVALYNTALSAARVSAHYTAGTAADNVSYRQDGPVYGAVWFNGTAGELTSSDAGFALTGSVSIGAWMNADAIGSLMGILGKGANLGGYALWIDASGYLNGGVGSGAATRSATGTTVLSAGVWYFAVLVWDATAYTVTLYLDGEKEGYASGGALTVGGYSGDMRVGSARDLTSTIRYLDGGVAEPWVLSAALTQTQVRAIYNRGLLEYGGTLREWLGQWPALHGESAVATTPYEIRVTHASAAPNIRAALVWRSKYSTA